MENKIENIKPSNPRMHNPSGKLAGEARNEDFFSLRDHFAGLAMQAHLSTEYAIMHTSNNENDELLAKRFYSFADAMLKERQNEV